MQNKSTQTHTHQNTVHTSVHLLLENTGNSKLLLMQQFRVHTERGRPVKQ